MQSKSLLKNTCTEFRKKTNSLFNNPYRQVGLNWFKLKYYKHLPSGKLRKHRLFGKYIYFYSASELLHGFKEIFLDKIYYQNLPPEPYIIDCGANIGLSVIYMKQLYPGATILAFEPDEKNFELLERNISSFNYTKVILRQEAVWTENTELNFSGDASMSSKIEMTGSSPSKKVKAIRLKELLDRKIDFLKMDIEGAEFAVITDLGDKLLLIDNLFIEYHGSFARNNELTKLFDIISANGFSYYIKEATGVYNTPFARPENPGRPFDIQLNIFCFRGDQ